MQINRLFVTPNDWILTCMRVVLGVVFFAHGAQKMLGWYGGNGFQATMSAFTGGMGIPAMFAFLAIAAEFFGGLGLIAGLLTRIAALGIVCVMLVAIYMVHWQHGLFASSPTGTGYELNLLALTLAFALMVRGGGALSLDRLITLRSPSARPALARV